MNRTGPQEKHTNGRQPMLIDSVSRKGSYYANGPLSTLTQLTRLREHNVKDDNPHIHIDRRPH